MSQAVPNESAATECSGQLAALGLEPRVAEAYLLVLDRPAWRLPELRVRLGLSAEAAGRLLERLADLGLVARGGADVVRLINPTVSLPALLAEREMEVARRTRDLERSRMAVADLSAGYAQRQPVHDVGTGAATTSPAATHHALQALVGSATSEVLVMSTATTATTDPINGLRELNADRLDPRVQYQVMLPDAARSDPLVTRRLRVLASSGVSVRTVSSVPLRALVVDGAAVAFPAGQTSTGVTLLRISSAAVATAELFERIWPTAAPLRDSSHVDPAGLTAREREVLAVLSVGGTDEAAAARLGLSVRTVRRVVSDVMAQLGARSRFQAGIKAAERGWLTS
jgi:DNA-binding NarL/FixJ family response regulator